MNIERIHTTTRNETSGTTTSGFFSLKYSLLLAASFVVCLSLSLLCAGLNAHAAQSTFTTTLSVLGVDTTAPSVPTGLSAMPVSTSAINLSWNASTYNVGVAGYRVYRDGAFLATTSQTNFADSGLTAATTYSYTVQAFDASLNYSAQSGSVSATTLSPAVVNGGGETSSGPVITGLTVTPSADGATVSFTTNVPTTGMLAWGLTSIHELGTTPDQSLSLSHQMFITDLQALTTYQVRVTAATSNGVSTYKDAVFSTLSVLPHEALPNPTQFTAEPASDRIALSWINPADPRFAEVRVLRSTDFFPRDPFDGQVVYEGTGSAADDLQVSVGTTYYYAIFAKAADGSYSSGALAEAHIARPGEVTKPVGDPFANLPQSQLTDALITKLTLADFDFIQEGRLLRNDGNEVIAVNGGENLTVRLAYGKVPEILKTIAITLADPTDRSKVFPFLLCVNADRTYYTATIGPLGRSGNYLMNIVVLDYRNQSLKRIAGSLEALVLNAIPVLGHGFGWIVWLILFIILVILVLLVILLRRRSRNRRELHRRLEKIEGQIGKIPIVEPVPPPVSLEETIRRFAEKAEKRKIVHRS